ncbi:hypothetical protein SprV_0100227400 [Sparganum proliferum]
MAASEMAEGRLRTPRKCSAQREENLCLLGQEGTTVSAEERSGVLRRRTVDRFDKGEEVLPFVAVRVPLDLLSFASSPGILHLAQSLLDEAATEICNVPDLIASEPRESIEGDDWKALVPDTSNSNTQPNKISEDGHR